MKKIEDLQEKNFHQYYIYLTSDVLNGYKIMSLKNSSKFFIIFGFVNHRYLTPVFMRLNCERLTLVLFIIQVFESCCQTFWPIRHGS